MKQLIIHCGADSTRMALMEDNKLVEYAAEPSQKRGIVGSFFKGKVMNVIPGMQAAFIDIGQKKNAFLYIDDALHPNPEKQPRPKPSITEVLKPGKELIVQVVKEAYGNKGARVTTHYSLPGRWLVYMPFAGYAAVSKKISPEELRSRLKDIGDELREEEEGLIIRTVAEESDTESIQEDLLQLRGVWRNIVEKGRSVTAPAVLHQELSMVQRLLRDAYSPETDELIMDCSEQAEEASAFLGMMLQKSPPPIQVYRGSEPIFDHFGISKQLDKDFQRKIWLPGGGYLVWDITEAMTVIDVNTGKFTGGEDLEDTVFQTNLEAAAEIGRLVRLRDPGGILIIDFIDMSREDHRSSVCDRLERSLAGDRMQHHILGWTRLGLLELTRKRMREQTVL